MRPTYMVGFGSKPRIMYMKATTSTSAPPRQFQAKSWPLQPFDFHTPTRVVHGPGSVQRSGRWPRNWLQAGPARIPPETYRPASLRFPQGVDESVPERPTHTFEIAV